MPKKKTKSECPGCGKLYVDLRRHKCPKEAEKVFIPGTEIELLPQLETLLFPIQKVIPDPANPRRTKTLEALKASFNRFGVRRPIVVNKTDNIIEAGHQSRAALLEMGATHIPVVFADDDRLDATAFNIADNRSNEITAEWDEAPLAKLLKELKAMDSVDSVGFEAAHIDKLIADFTVDENPGGDGEESPEEFKNYGDSIRTDYRCPKCSYEWSGKPKSEKPESEQ